MTEDSSQVARRMLDELTNETIVSWKPFMGDRAVIIGLQFLREISDNLDMYVQLQTCPVTTSHGEDGSIRTTYHVDRPLHGAKTQPEEKYRGTD